MSGPGGQRPTGGGGGAFLRPLLALVFCLLGSAVGAQATVANATELLTAIKAGQSPITVEPGAYVTKAGTAKTTTLLPGAVVLAFIHGAANGSTPPPRCPYTDQLASDGCLTAPAGGTYLLAQPYATYITGAGYAWISPHPWNFNLAGWDYGIGPYNAYVDPTVSVPAGCVYQPTGSLTGGPQILCNSAAANVDIEDPDFTLHNGVTLYLGSGLNGGSVRINDAKFKIGSNNNASNGYLIRSDTSAPVTITSSELDGNYPTFTSVGAGLVGLLEMTSPACNLTLNYVAFHDAPGRPINATNGCVENIHSSVAKDWVLANPSIQHGEWFENSASPGASNTISAYIADFNLGLTSAAAPSGITGCAQGCGTATLYFSSGQTSTITLTYGEVQNNIFIALESGGHGTGKETNAIAGLRIDYPTITTLNYTGNWFFAPGSFGCSFNSAPASTVGWNTSNNTDLGNGGVVVGFGTNSTGGAHCPSAGF